MDKTSIKIKKKVKINKPIMVEGLPGIGLVGKIAADHLIREKKAAKIANIYSPAFPPQVLMKKNGICRMLGMRVYHIPGKKNDLLVLVGDVQATTPESHYELCGRIIKYFKKHGGNFIITLGGYGTGKHSETPKVFGAASHKELVKKYSKSGIEFGKTRGSIVGAAGLLLGMGKIEGIKGICIMGETHGGYIDPKSALAVLDKLSEVLGMEINTSKLEEKVKEGQKFIKKMEEKAAKDAGTDAHAGSVRDLSYIR
ncbi:MAG: proteasome assembly chaperone family protein [Candidatus Micrarchaeota archaeon]